MESLVRIDPLVCQADRFDLLMRIIVVDGALLVCVVLSVLPRGPSTGPLLSGWVFACSLVRGPEATSA